MYHLKMEKQTNNAWSARTPTPAELLVGNKNSLQLLQPQVSTQLMLGKATTTSENKHPQHQQTLSRMNLVRAACVPETS
jgi:hypothetical protein